jgi:hypothetical protein
MRFMMRSLQQARAEACPFAGTCKVPGHVTIIDATNLALNPPQRRAFHVITVPIDLDPMLLNP